MPKHQIDGAFTQIEHCAAQLLKGICSCGRAEDSLGVLEAGVAPERDVQKAEHGENAHDAFHEPFAKTTEAEHGAIVGGSFKN